MDYRENAEAEENINEEYAEFHNKTGCDQAECPLMKPGYERQLWLAAEWAAKRVNGGFGSLEEEGAVDYYNAISLVDGTNLHKPLCLKRFREDRDDESVFAEMVPIFRQRSLFDGENVGANLELLLWAALNSGNVDILSTTLTEKGELVPKCVLSSLLLKAILLANDKAVKILLNIGASPNAVEPFRTFLERFKAVSWDDQAKPLANEIRNRLITILRSLIEHGADFQLVAPVSLVSRFEDERTYLHHLSVLALENCGEASVTLVEMAPPKMLLEKQEAPIDDQHDEDVIDEYVNRLEPDWQYYYGIDDYYGSLPFGCVMTRALYDAARAPLHDQSGNNTAKILNYAVLPLLRAGAICQPDPLEGRRISLALAELIATTPEEVQLRLWGRKDGIVPVVLEMRQKASLNVAKMMATLEEQLKIHLPTFHAWLRNFVATFQAQYPRQLQAQCRIAILRRMPFGAKARRDALGKLNLPSCLFDYLQFKDIEILPGSFSSNNE